MLSWLFVCYTLGPTLLTYSLAYAFRHPESLPQLALAIPLGALLTVIGFWLANRYLRLPRARHLAPYRRFLIMAGLLTALVLGLFFLFSL